MPACTHYTASGAAVPQALLCHETRHQRCQACRALGWTCHIRSQECSQSSQRRSQTRSQRCSQRLTSATMVASVMPSALSVTAGLMATCCSASSERNLPCSAAPQKQACLLEAQQHAAQSSNNYLTPRRKAA